MTSRQHASKPAPAQRTPSTAPAGRERRQHARIAIEAEVGFASENNFYTGFSEDISEGGIFVTTYDLQPLGTEFDLKFALPNGHEVKVKGVVRWLREPHDFGQDGSANPGMGIQFQDLESDDMKVVREFIAARAPLFYDE